VARGLSSRANIAPGPTPLGNLGVTTLDLSSPRPRWSSGLAPALVSGHGGPDESHQFARDRRHGDRRAFAVADGMAVAAVQALLRPPRVADDLVKVGTSTKWATGTKIHKTAGPQQAPGPGKPDRTRRPGTVNAS